MPNMRDVAALVGVSTATVSHYLNGTRPVSKETGEKIRRAMKEINYVPNMAARALRTNDSKTFGLLVPDLSSFFYYYIAQAIEEVVSERGYSLMLCSTKEDLQREVSQLGELYSRSVRGIFITPTRPDFDYRAALQSGNCSMVFIDRRTELLQGDFVYIDSRGAFRDAVTHLAHQGHKKIGYIKKEGKQSSANERVESFFAALQYNGLRPDPGLVLQGGAQVEEGYRLCEKLATTTDVTAIVVSNSIMVVGAMLYLKEHGIDIPGKIAVIGFDDYYWMPLVTPALSTISQPILELGRTAAGLMLERIGQKGPGEGPVVRGLPSRFVLRKSC